MLLQTWIRKVEHRPDLNLQAGVSLRSASCREHRTMAKGKDGDIPKRGCKRKSDDLEDGSDDTEITTKALKPQTKATPEAVIEISDVDTLLDCLSTCLFPDRRASHVTGEFNLRAVTTRPQLERLAKALKTAGELVRHVNPDGIPFKSVDYTGGLQLLEAMDILGSLGLGEDGGSSAPPPKKHKTLDFDMWVQTCTALTAQSSTTLPQAGARGCFICTHQTQCGSTQLQSCTVELGMLVISNHYT